MATFKEYIFVNNRRKDGTYAVSIRVTHNRKSRYIPTNIYVNDSQITRTGKIKDRYIQDIIDKKLKEYRDGRCLYGTDNDRKDQADKRSGWTELRRAGRKGWNNKAKSQ